MYIHVHVYLPLLFPVSILRLLLLDNLPEEKTIIDTDRLRGEDPSLDLSWTPLDEDNGVEFLTNYLVRITITGLPQASRSRRQIQPRIIERTVDKSESSYSFDQIEPFTQYEAQVFAQLLINGISSLAAVTAPITADSNETGFCTVFLSIH